MARKHTLVLFALATLAAPAFAGGIDGSAVIGGALGGGTGAAVGSAIGGRDGAIIGGAIGGAAGAAIGSKSSRPAVVEREVVYVHDHDHDHHDNGLHRGHHKGKHGRDDN
ncbi:MAG: glycine zipper domain-containing protein [Thiobacillus sp.]